MRRLYKSRRYKIIDGVCGGIAEYFEIDPTIVRVLWIIITVMGGFGFFLYIAGMILMPVDPEFANGKVPQPPENGKKDTRRFWGILLILIGALVLISNLGWFAAFHWWHISWGIVFPAFLILFGIWFITLHKRKSGSAATAPQETPPGPPPPAQDQVKELRRSVRDKKLFGVCGGIANYFGIDPTLVRILYIVLILISFGWGLLLYIILAILMPEEKLTVVQ